MRQFVGDPIAGNHSSAEPSSVSSTLLERIKAHRPEAWERLVDLYGPVVYRWCRQYGLGSDDAADVLQDVFAAVAANVGEFHRRDAHDTFGGWLRTITHNKVRDFFRQRHGQPEARGGTDAQQQLANLCEPSPPTPLPWAGEGMETPSGPTGSVETDSGFLRRALELVRAEFENRTWDAFWRTTVDGRSPADVAQELGMSLQAVYKAKSRVLRRLRWELGDLL
jgi:RNA polymerase sigma-70 factor (ECF subfamily)